MLSDVGYQPFVRELDELATGDDKRKLLTLLFEVAAADGEISHEEHEEIRKISKALHLEHSEFTTCATRAPACSFPPAPIPKPSRFTSDIRPFR